MAEGSVTYINDDFLHYNFILPFLCRDGREDKLAALEEQWIYVHATGYGTKTTARYFPDLNKDFPLKYQDQIKLCSP